MVSTAERNGSARLGVAVQGIGGAVATTAIAGMALLRRGLMGREGLPLASVDADLIAYENLVFGGWDIHGQDLAQAGAAHGVLPMHQLDAVREELAAITPWPAVSNESFHPAVRGGHRRAMANHREAVEALRADLRRFREVEQLGDRLVLLNLASTEVRVDPTEAIFATPEAYEAALDANDPRINPASLTCYAAIQEGVPYVNFTPSAAAELPALRQLAERRNVPVAGKDGKTGQTFIKTVLAPAFRDRALEVEGWFSTNILGNRDGLALANESQLANKIESKESVLDQIVGHRVENHLVQIHYYPPRGDAKEAWDAIDLRGFAGATMQMKINFQCRDSILAAPLAIDLVRLLDLARRRGEGGMMEAFSVFFKSPGTRDGSPPDHDFFRQQRRLMEWLGAVSGKE